MTSKNTEAGKRRFTLRKENKIFNHILSHGSFKGEQTVFRISLPCL